MAKAKKAEKTEKARKTETPKKTKETKKERRAHDSTRTRVAPVFDALLAQDATGEKWLGALLALPRGGRSLDAGLAARPGTLDQAHWSSRTKKAERREKALEPPASLLSWLARHLGEVHTDTIAGDDTKAERRNALRAGDPATVARAIAKLRSEPKPRAWYRLEGASRPDVFLATPDAVIVIEGKRTEAGPTTSTTWLPGRHQMLRHMDAAYEVAGRRRVLGFFVVEGDEAGAPPKAWLEAARATLSRDAVEGSLPHRPAPERDAITRGFLGVTTWQEICDRCGLDPAIL